MNFNIQNPLIAGEDDYTTFDVKVLKGIISAIASSLDVVGEVIEGKNKLLLPGFVNAHTHSSEMWQCGISILPRNKSKRRVLKWFVGAVRAACRRQKRLCDGARLIFMDHSYVHVSPRIMVGGTL